MPATQRLSPATMSSSMAAVVQQSPPSSSHHHRVTPPQHSPSSREFVCSHRHHVTVQPPWSAIFKPALRKKNQPSNRKRTSHRAPPALQSRRKTPRPPPAQAQSPPQQPPRSPDASDAVSPPPATTIRPARQNPIVIFSEKEFFGWGIFPILWLCTGKCCFLKGFVGICIPILKDL
ncbi:hypothetical protein V8G54_023870 [Vigna mungo]|uniref:Uncharacterized protein n=1 Tax=Vigna mungo TaxID=3915 RepID=A0AAQ3RSN1_VIGMU